MTEENKDWTPTKRPPKVPASHDNFDKTTLEKTWKMLKIVRDEYDTPETQEEHEKIKEVLELTRQFDMEVTWVNDI